jgi:hypothetical protein
MSKELGDWEMGTIHWMKFQGLENRDKMRKISRLSTRHQSAGTEILFAVLTSSLYVPNMHQT